MINGFLNLNDQLGNLNDLNDDLTDLTRNNKNVDSVLQKSALYPCSTKMREVLGNPSPTPERFPETREISQGRSPREISD